MKNTDITTVLIYNVGNVMLVGRGWWICLPSSRWWKLKFPQPGEKFHSGPVSDGCHKGAKWKQKHMQHYNCLPLSTNDQ